MGRAWIAPVGTPLDAPGWTEIGTVDADGIGYEEGEPIPAQWPFATRVTITMAARITWSGYRWLFGRVSPAASRVKREYHRRRR